MKTLSHRDDGVRPNLPLSVPENVTLASCEGYFISDPRCPAPTDGAFITGSDFLMDGGVTSAFWYGELGPK
jgi:hypothetical protein